MKEVKGCGLGGGVQTCFNDVFPVDSANELSLACRTAIVAGLGAPMRQSILRPDKCCSKPERITNNTSLQGDVVRHARGFYFCVGPEIYYAQKVYFGRAFYRRDGGPPLLFLFHLKTIRSCRNYNCIQFFHGAGTGVINWVDVL